MKDQFNSIVDTMCVPGLVELNASDLSFLHTSSDVSMVEYCEDNVKSAVKKLCKCDLSGIKNLAVSVCANANDRQISISEIGGLRDVCSRLADDTNVLWGFGFGEVPTGKRKVTVLLAR